MHDLTRRAPFMPNATHPSHVQRMPTIMDQDILPDMGRMSARLLWEENHGSSPAPIAVADALLPCIA
jgi:hypothetical protein